MSGHGFLLHVCDLQPGSIGRLALKSADPEEKPSILFNFFRDNSMAAYPALKRDPFNPDPHFARRNPGIWFGGPVIKDRLFFFSNYEYTSQASIVTFQPNLASASGARTSSASGVRGPVRTIAGSGTMDR